MRYGCVDRRLGTTDKSSTCETCHKNMADCPGHFGYVKLVLPVLHIGYMKATVTVLQMVCKSCSRVLLPKVEKEGYIARLRRTADVTQRRAVWKQVWYTVRLSRYLCRSRVSSLDIRKSSKSTHLLPLRRDEWYSKEDWCIESDSREVQGMFYMVTTVISRASPQRSTCKNSHQVLRLPLLITLN